MKIVKIVKIGKEPLSMGFEVPDATRFVVQRINASDWGIEPWLRVNGREGRMKVVNGVMRWFDVSGNSVVIPIGTYLLDNVYFRPEGKRAYKVRDGVIFHVCANGVKWSTLDYRDSGILMSEDFAKGTIREVLKRLLIIHGVEDFNEVMYEKYRMINMRKAQEG